MVNAAAPGAGAVHLGLCGMVLLWGLSWPSGRWLAQVLPPLSLSAWRFTLAALVLLVWMRLRQGAWWPELSGRQVAGLVLTGAVGVFGYSVFFMYGLKMVEASRAAVVVTTNPVFVTLLAAWLFREPFNARIGLGLALAVLGAATVMTQGRPWAVMAGGVGLGEWMLVGCVVTWASYSLMGKRLMVGIDALAATALTASVGAVLLWAAALIVDGPSLALGRLALLSLPESGNLVFMALGPTVLAYAWFYRGIEALGAGVASSYISLVPVFGVASSVVLLGEPLSGSLLVGGAMALAGVVMANRARRVAAGSA